MKHSLINIVTRKNTAGESYYQARFFDKGGQLVKAKSYPGIKNRTEAYLHSRKELEQGIIPSISIAELENYGIFTVEEVKNILALPDSRPDNLRYILAVLLGITCGLGVTEIINLSFENRTLNDMFEIRNSHTTRLIPFIGKLKDKLDKIRNYYPNSRYIIPNLKDMSKPCDPITINRALEFVITKLGIGKERNIISSRLQETFITLLLACKTKPEIETIDYLCGFGIYETDKLKENMIGLVSNMMIILENLSYTPNNMNWHKYS
jgi:integrase